MTLIEDGNANRSIAVFAVWDGRDIKDILRFADNLFAQSVPIDEVYIACPKHIRGSFIDKINVTFISFESKEEIIAAAHNAVEQSKKTHIAFILDIKIVPTYYFHELTLFHARADSKACLFGDVFEFKSNDYIGSTFDRYEIRRLGLISPIVILQKDSILEHRLSHTTASEIEDFNKRLVEHNGDLADLAVIISPTALYVYIWYVISSYNFSNFCLIGKMAHFRGATLPSYNNKIHRKAVNQRSKIARVVYDLCRAYSGNDLEGKNRLSPELATRSSLPIRQKAAEIEEVYRNGVDAQTDEEIIIQSGLFDRLHYLRLCKDRFIAPENALKSYIEVGKDGFYSPSLYFDAQKYLQINNDVKDSGSNPLVHYLRFGRPEGRSRWTINGEVDGHAEMLLLHYDLFNKDFYLYKYDDIRNLKVDPIWHYLRYGGLEMRSPTKWINPFYYNNMFPEIIANGHNPMLFYISFGKDAGHKLAPVRQSRLKRESTFDSSVRQLSFSQLQSFEPNHDFYQQIQADMLCCLPYKVKFNLTIKIMMEAELRNIYSLVTIRSKTPSNYSTDNSQWAESPQRVMLLFDLIDPIHKQQFIQYLVSVRKIKVLWIAGDVDLYPMLPYLKRSAPALRIVDQLFNDAGHTRLSMLYEKFVDRFIVESKYMKNYLLKNEIPDANIVTILSGIDLKKFDRRNLAVTQIENIRQKILKNKGAAPIVGYVGRLSSEKNPLGFIEFASRLLKCTDNVAFMICGDGPSMKETQTQADLKLAGCRYAFLGFVDDIRYAIAACDIIIVPSKVDGRPGVIMEAAALNVPVIGSDVGGIPEMIEETINGYLFSLNSMDKIIHKTLDLLQSKFKLDRMKTTSRQHAEINFNEINMYANYIETIKPFIS